MRLALQPASITWWHLSPPKPTTIWRVPYRCQALHSSMVAWELPGKIHSFWKIINQKIQLIPNFLPICRFVAVYLTLPETERRTLEEIELHFSDNNRKITDIYIQRISDSKDNNNAKCIEAGEQIGTKSMSVIGDIVEMNSKSPSVVSSATTPNNGPSHLASSPGCDNKAFTNDRWRQTNVSFLFIIRIANLVLSSHFIV